MKTTLKVSPETFNNMINGLIASGVTFTAHEIDDEIMVEFTGGC